MGIKVKMYNELEIKAMLENSNVDFNNFYKSDLVQFLEVAQKIIKQLKKDKSCMSKE